MRAIAGEWAEGDIARELAVVREQGDGPAAAGVKAQRQSIHGRLRDLVRGEHGELHAELGEDHERLLVHRRLGEPAPLGVAPEAPPEIGESPAQFDDLVAPRGEGQDHMVVRGGDGVAVAAKPDGAGRVGGENGAIRGRRRALHPLQQGRADVEAQRLIHIHHVRDAPIGRQQPRGRHGGVALALDALVPVVRGGGIGLALHDLEPGILARRLVEMSVHHHRPRGSGGGHVAAAGARWSTSRTASSTPGKTSSRRRSSSANSAVPAMSVPGSSWSAARRRAVSSACSMKRRSA